MAKRGRRFFLVAALLFVIGALMTGVSAAGSGPKAGHAYDATHESCLDSACHARPGGVKPVPENHGGRAVSTCKMCHDPA